MEQLTKDDVILAQEHLIAQQSKRIDELLKQVDTLVESINWYENETKHNATFEQLRGELETLRVENKVLKYEVYTLAIGILDPQVDKTEKEGKCANCTAE